MGCRSHQRQIEAYFAGELSPRRQTVLRAHVRGCAECQRLYDQLAALEESLAGHGWPGTELAKPHAERLLTEIHAGLGAATAAYGGGVRRWAVATAAALCLLVAVVGAVLLWQRSTASSRLEYAGTEFRVRGFDETPLASRRLGVRLFCIDPGRVDQAAPPHYRVHEIDSVELGGRGTCPESGVLYFAATNLLDAPRQLFLVGVTAQHEVRWYYPKPDEAGSLPLPAGTLDAPIGRGIMLEINHQPGPHRVFALLSEQPLTVDQVAAAVREKAVVGSALDRLAQLPIAGVTQQLVFDLDIEVQP